MLIDIQSDCIEITNKTEKISSWKFFDEKQLQTKHLRIVCYLHCAQLYNIEITGKNFISNCLHLVIFISCSSFLSFRFHVIVVNCINLLSEQRSFLILCHGKCISLSTKTNFKFHFISLNCALCTNAATTTITSQWITRNCENISNNHRQAFYHSKMKRETEWKI